MLELYLIRHAQSIGNTRPHIIGGQSNELKLTKKGELEAQLLGERLKYEGVLFDEIYSSTAMRTTQTATIVANHISFDPKRIVRTNRILELDQGEWQGKLRCEKYTKDVLATINRSNGAFAPPRGESQKAVEARMLGWLQETIMDRYPLDTKIAVFGHGMAIKCLFRGIFNFSPQYTHNIELDNTSISKLKYDKKGWYICSINDTAHLYFAAKSYTLQK